jgi:hypothetical protein
MPDFARAMFSLAPAAWQLETESVAIRGKRLALSRHTYRDANDAERPITVEALMLAEVGDGELVYYTGVFDLDDLDGATAELDARYLAGEATPHANAWSVIAGLYAAFNGREFPATTPDWVGIDHRSLFTVEAGDMRAFNREVRDQVPNLNIHAEAVHRLTDLGAVVTHVARGVSQDGFEAAWRLIFIFKVDGDLISGYEMFDEQDLDAAVARFEELNIRPV